MYRIGRKDRKHTKRKIWVVILMFLLLCCIVGAYFAYTILSEDTEVITTTESITREYAPPQGEDVKEFSQDAFSVTLPADWVFKGTNSTVHTIFSYQATKKNADNRTLEIYVDNVPTDKAFNRMLPVIIEENRIKATGSVSDNCVEFTGQNNVNPQTTTQPVIDSKWQGVAFRCDVANRSRNLVGVGMVDAGTNIVLNRPSGAKRTFYFLYIDHNINPDYKILEDALESFVTK